jgi:hypothetical protein
MVGLLLVSCVDMIDTGRTTRKVVACGPVPRGSGVVGVGGGVGAVGRLLVVARVERVAYSCRKQPKRIDREVFLSSLPPSRCCTVL